jgi:hypothetical protein
LNQPQARHSESRISKNHREQCSRESACHSRSTQTPRPDRAAPHLEWKTEAVIDTTNNKLQELMQLLYLLSRDPSVPADARYHVTVAQSEIALLTRVMQNALAEDDSADGPSSSLDAT